MQKLTRRTLLKGMALGSAGLVLAACAPAVAPSAPAASEGGAEGAADAPTKLVVSSFYPVDQTAGWKGLVGQYEAAHPNVTVETQVTPWDEYLPKLLTQLAAGTSPDVIGVENSPFIRFVTGNVLLDLTSYFETDSDFKREDFFTRLINRYTVDGKVYGVPYDVQPKCSLFYNKGLFDAAGVAYPTNEWRWADLLEAAQALTKTEGDRISQYGFFTYNAINELFFVYSNGGTLVDSVEKPVKATFDNPKSIEGVQFWADMILKHKVAPSPSFFQGAGQGAGDLFSTGRLAMFLGGYWEFVFDPDKLKQVDLGLQIGPAGPDGNRAYATGGTAYSVGSGTKQPELAWDFVKYFMGMPGYEAAVAEAKYGVIYPPAYLPAYNSEIFAKMPNPPIENMTINGDAAEFAVYEPQHPNWLEIRSTIIQPMSDLVANGEKSAEEAMLEMQPLVQAGLDKPPA